MLLETLASYIRIPGLEFPLRSWFQFKISGPVNKDVPQVSVQLNERKILITNKISKLNGNQLDFVV